ncbi:enoyl-CoA hydratase-related protein [Paenactinomyces guangxiensis]|uniref:Enoyl-CoA hydratase/isomerase family protein n=1 Tax=Paenactinomyces guangxiensis TaxID=1490290 RepID=A0A7W1WRW2_9BACL|nr:enoyl-CoA hydratase-related protein [Paenactinomyces guangxiensis]MBA4494916.1 enoyl-CoA hydratase/isomerase family protein [Paenactinomyces guangxiensis]MBH8591999.1 enoyl-CoA hydratase/isomerase family protein [Paenactinomyces guangxiensis]
MAEKTVTLTREEGVGIIKLNRPHVYNAFNNQMSLELQEQLKEAGSDPQIRALILTGEGKAFCSGQDLNDRSAMKQRGETISLGESVRSRYNPIVMAIANLDKPIIAAVNGVAAGAGCSLALACDMRFITPKTRFVEAFARIGLVPDSGSSYFLPRLVGLGRALEIAMTGRDVEADEAMKIGLANRMVPAEDLLEETFSFARKLAQGPTVAVSLTKKAILKGMEGTLEEALEFEAQAQEVAGRTQDFLEGVQAFTEKRKPRFQGK